MNHYNYEVFTGERALFKGNNLEINYSVFQEGESPLKESHDIRLQHDLFRWKYPLWYCQNVEGSELTFTETARSGIWYTNNIALSESVIQAPKTFRRCSTVRLTAVELPNAQETLWNCQNIELTNVTAAGDYFGMNSQQIEGDHLVLTGNYAFDGAKDIHLKNSKLLSKDAFWNCENVVVEDSLIIGEYLGWNSKNVTLINCVVESNQGMCYMDNLKMINCTVINTDLAFEYSTVDVQIKGRLESVKNPVSGVIEAEEIKELIFDDTQINQEATEIRLTQKDVATDSFKGGVNSAC